MVPAGFELENPALGNSIKLEELSIEGKPAWQSEWNDYLKHQEFRDDRYTAALDLSAGEQPATGLPDAGGDAGSLSGAADPGGGYVPSEIRAVGEDIHEVRISE